VVPLNKQATALSLRRSACLLLCIGLLGAAACTAAGTPSERSSEEADSTRPRRSFEATGKWYRRSCRLPSRYLELIHRGTFPGRSPELTVVPDAPNFFGSFEVTTHSGPWQYLQRIPLVLYGPGYVQRGGDVTLDREATAADIAPTLAELLEIEWPEDRAGAPITEALVPEAERPEPPRMILVVVWDGGGWNVLHQWPKAWSNLRRLMREGTSVQGAVAGSSPSVTPAVHASIGTGAWPLQHGVVDLQWRTPAGKLKGSYEGDQPAMNRVTSLADIYDPTTGNAAQIGMLAERNWHMGMIGHGAHLEGGDKDIMVLGSGAGEDNYSNENFYSLPKYIRVPGVLNDVRAVDLEDGRIDDAWLGHEVLAEPDNWNLSPVQTRYQTRQIKAIFRNEDFGQDEVPDLFYTNYKELDVIGHIHNMMNPESRSILRQTDAELGKLTTFLDNHVGVGEWVIAVTADHGQGPHPLRSGAWPINADELGRDAARHFGLDLTDLFDKMRITGFWTNSDVMKRKGVSLSAVADWLVGYRLRDNIQQGERVPDEYEARMKERLFAAAFPTKELPRLLLCSRSGS
jgi:hypothetical protein